VIDLASGKVLFADNPDKPLIPASNTKVFVMTAALAELGPAFEFETMLATDGSNLIVVGDGDPALGDEKLCDARGEPSTAVFQRWADALKRRGMTAIPGDIVIDESIFDGRLTHPSWEQADLGKWYAAPVGALNFNDNCVDITVSPAKKAGAPAWVSVQPENSVARIINKCRTGGKPDPVLHHPHDTFDYIINGRCKKRWRFVSVSFPDPGLLFADSLRTVLAQNGIRVAGTIQRQRVRSEDGGLPTALAVVARHQTPLAEVLKRVGKNSQNLFAECLLKRTGHAWAKRRGSTDPVGSWELGRQAVTDVIQRAGINTTGLNVADGSGLSRDNRSTARQLARTVAWVYAQPGGQLFHDSLSTAGVDGSLHKRLKDLPGAVRGKTGTMRGIRTLSGYIEANTGPRYAFAVMFNDYKGPSTPYRQIQDRICRILVGAATAEAHGE
jgi:D-alanyl-D-alanine carboxypeptidase/D-alanyl-D-alanine-endopeptidase (penicillin-binding protein 4)